MLRYSHVVILIGLLVAGCGQDQSMSIRNNSTSPPLVEPQPAEQHPKGEKPRDPDHSTMVVTLKPAATMHFKISIPENWVVSLPSHIQDQVILRDPADPEVAISVFTFLRKDVTRDSVLERWQFKDRNPQPFVGPSGIEGLVAEGPDQLHPETTTLAVGYWAPNRWVQIAEASAPKDRYADMKPLYERVLKTLQPHPGPK